MKPLLLLFFAMCKCSFPSSRGAPSQRSAGMGSVNKIIFIFPPRLFIIKLFLLEKHQFFTFFIPFFTEPFGPKGLLGPLIRGPCGAIQRGPLGPSPRQRPLWGLWGGHGAALASSSRAAAPNPVCLPLVKRDNPLQRSLSAVASKRV